MDNTKIQKDEQHSEMTDEDFPSSTDSKQKGKSEEDNISMVVSPPKVKWLGKVNKINTKNQLLDAKTK